MSIINERIKELREEHNLTQTQLGQKLGVSQAGIAKWETGDRTPSADCIILLAKFFKVSSDYLLGIDDDQLENK